MRIRTTLIVLCTAALAPLSAAAKPPASAACAVLVNGSDVPGVGLPVAPGIPFPVTVLRDPQYPGQWFSPTVEITVAAPLLPPLVGGPYLPTSWSQTVAQSFQGLGGPNEATAIFVVPEDLNVDGEGAVNVFATVSEPINGGKSSRVSYCEAATMFATP